MKTFVRVEYFYWAPLLFISLNCYAARWKIRYFYPGSSAYFETVHDHGNNSKTKATSLKMDYPGNGITSVTLGFNEEEAFSKFMPLVRKGLGHGNLFPPKY